MLGQSRNTVFCNDSWVGRVEKVGSLKRRVRSHRASWDVKNCTPLSPASEHLWKLWYGKMAHRCWAKVIISYHVKMPNNWPSPTTFGSSDAVKWRTAVTGSAFPSQKDHSWRDRGRKMLLSRAAHVLVKILNTLGPPTTFGRWDAEALPTAVARSTFPSQIDSSMG